MSAPDTFFPLSDPKMLTRIRGWLLLGVAALGIAGIFAGMLGATKSDYFYTALVVHVDLSVLVWFLTFACLFFTIAAQGRGWGALADAGFYSFASGALLIVVSGFTGGAAYMSNYIPVIHHPVFFLALGLLLSGVLCTVCNLLFACSSRDGVQSFGIVTAAFIMLLSIICFVWSQQSLPKDLHGQIYYEYAFWGGGHVLQFVHTQLMLVAWLWLAQAAGLKIRLGNKSLIALYLFGVLAALAAPFIYASYAPTSDEHRNAFTMLMKHANGLAPLVLSIFIIIAFFTSSKANTKLAKTCLLMSILLFAAGGGLGYMIAGSNVTVPAHYHGSIVGITLAFMGVAYLLMPYSGFADVTRSKLALAQPIIYGGGQLCWMTGMAMLGAHGVPRKTPGSADTMGALASFLKHGGDGLALIGGLLFVFVVLKAAYQSPRRAV